ncbi:MAG TPA: ATPase, T2SS/T4P/T4SS family [Gaiellaceae bacterium]|nr:ATPase, T2SS/T4P/T4SS family [Gaiellaceae bacterium]
MEAAAHPWPTLGVLMLRDGLVAKAELEAILNEQRDSRQQRMSGHRLGEILIERGLVTPTDVAKLVAEQYELPFTELDTTDIEVHVARRFSEELARRISAIPINTRPDGSCVLAIADPATVLFSDELRRVLGPALQFVVVGPDAMEAAIRFVFDRADEQAGAPEVPEPGYFEGTVLELRPEDPAAVVAPHASSPIAAHASPTTHHSPPLGALLVREGLLSEDELDAALAQQRLSTSWRLGEILVNRGLVTPAGIARVIAEQYELPFVDLANAYVDPAVASRLPREIARNFPAVPIAEGSDGSLQVAIADPTNVYYSDELQDSLGVALTFVVAAPDAIDGVLDSVHEPAPDPEHAEAYGETDTSVASFAFDDELPAAVEVGEVVAETGDDLPDFDYGTGAVDGVLVDETVAESDDLTAGLYEHVVAEEATVEETVVEEPVLGWLPTWTTEIKLVDDEPELGDEPEATDSDSDDLTAALLAEVVQTDELDNAEEIGDTAETPGTVTYWEHDEEVAPEPAPVIAFVEHVVVEGETDEAEVAEETEDSEMSSPIEEPVQLEATASTADLEDVDVTVEHVLGLGATAIHFSPNDGEYLVRARVDGSVRELGVVPRNDMESIVERLQSSVAVRVQVMPTAKGDKVTLFPLEGITAPTELGELGLAMDSYASVRDALARPSGAFVVCGPVGSGTTTTLYAALRVLNTPDRVVATIEDPIDHNLLGVDQVQVDVTSGATLADGLRTLLASDFDAVLIGEIRDRETAEVAFAGALAGRHVLSALRAPGAAAAIRRLLELGLEPSSVCDALTCVVAQRLVRRVCLDCRETHYATESELAELGLPLEGNGPRLLARGRGCKLCDGTGFRGRAGIFEVMSVTDEIRALVADDASAKKLQRAALAGGMRTLREDGVRLCLEGVTTSAELQRVLGTESSG